MGSRAGLDRCGKSPPTGIRSPDSPVRGVAIPLYRLSYPGPRYRMGTVVYLRGMGKGRLDVKTTKPMRFWSEE